MTRAFVKHKVFGTVYAVELDEQGGVLAAVQVTPATVCAHILPTLGLSLDEAGDLIHNLSDYAAIDLPCSNPVHQLADIGRAERECEEAEATYDTAHAKARAAKEMLETKEQALRKMVRQATQPVALPLFESLAGDL